MNPFLTGKRISLCSLAPSDLDPQTPYYRWLDDLTLDLYSERSYFPNSPQRMESYYQLAAEKKLVLLGICDVGSGRHIGNITLQEFDWINRRAFIGYLIGEKEFTGKGIASEACLMMMYYGFNKLNFERIWTTVSEENVGSLKVALNAGLKEEGRLRRHQLRNGKRHDLVTIGALRDEWMAERGDKAKQSFAVLPI